PGLQESQPLHLAVLDPLRTAAGEDQRTLKTEEPVNGDSITIQARFPALLVGKYSAILEGNLHTTKWFRETLELSGKNG
ncbi:hypothetical protein ACQXX4_12160, partial [Corynebacterium diphtheriae]